MDYFAWLYFNVKLAQLFMLIFCSSSWTNKNIWWFLYFWRLVFMVLDVFGPTSRTSSESPLSQTTTIQTGYATVKSSSNFTELTYISQSLTFKFVDYEIALIWWFKLYTVNILSWLVKEMLFISVVIIKSFQKDFGKLKR